MYYQKYLLKTPQLASNSTSDPNRKFNWLSKPEKEFDVMDEIYVALHICTRVKKDDIFRKRGLNSGYFGPLFGKN